MLTVFHNNIVKGKLLVEYLFHTAHVIAKRFVEIIQLLLISCLKKYSYPKTVS